MSLTLAHARLTTLALARYPAFVFPTVCFPAMFFLFFATSARGHVATYALCSFAAFAVLGVAFFQFGVGIAAERTSPWEQYVRTLPVSTAARLGARLISAAGFSVVSATLVVVVALATTDAALSPVRWLELAAVLAAGIVPFGLLGIALGYWASPRGALPIANILYLALSFGGGLWVRPDRLPRPVAAISPFLPTRPLSEALRGIVVGTPWQLSLWVVLAGFSVLFATAAIAGYRRDEGQRFR